MTLVGYRYELVGGSIEETGWSDVYDAEDGLLLVVSVEADSETSNFNCCVAKKKVWAPPHKIEFKVLEIFNVENRQDFLATGMELAKKHRL